MTLGTLNTSSEDGTGDEGREQRYSFTSVEGVTLRADTLGELIDQMVDGYADLAFGPQPEIRQWAACHHALTTSVSTARDTKLRALLDAGEIDPAVTATDVIDVLFTDPDTPIAAESWDEIFPLILFSTTYAPFTTAQRPEGAEIIWVSGHTELLFLQSLEAIGLGRFEDRRGL